MRIYKIEHYYNHGRNECKHSIFVESDIKPDQMANIVGAIQLKFETIQNKEDDIDDQHLLQLLKSYYRCIDVKEKYQHVLEQTVVKDEDWERIVYIPIVDGKNKYEIIQIDLYEAREKLLYVEYLDSIKCLPNNDEFVIELGDLSKYYSQSL